MGTSPSTPRTHEPVTPPQAHRPFSHSPTRAGFTGSSSLLGQVLLDHPRSRGVYLSANHLAFPGNGSSPLARGLRFVVCGGRARCGIIPARAGFTRDVGPRSHERRDHPRSRGVYGPPRSVELVDSGSSPLARGLRRSGRVGRPGRRIIPARAGFTSLAAATKYVAGDHPRSRGVYRQE